jgi:hypothetical protein
VRSIGAAEPPGLSLKKQSFINTGRKAFFKNKRTGQILSYDIGWMRYHRMRKAIRAWSGLESGDWGNNSKLAMVTLTYRPGENYSPGDKREFVQKLKRGLGKRLFGYAWVGELQKRGAVHYHVLLKLQKGTIVPHPDQVGWWDHGLTSVTNRVRTPFYLLKYVGKEYQKEFANFPKGMHCFAVVLTDAGERQQLRWLRLPLWAFDDPGWRDPEILKKIKEEHKKTSEWVFIAATYNQDLDLRTAAFGIA